VFAGSLMGRVSTAVRSRTHLYTPAALSDLLREHVRAERIEELAVPFQCVAASIEHAAEHWFDSGPLIDAVLASSAVPGLLPPVGIGGEHFVDGGLVNSIPVGRAVALGAREIYVLQVGRVERPLTPPKLPWDVATVAFEIARRHRFARDMADLPAHVTVHVLPSGAAPGDAGGTLSQLRHRAFGQTAERIERAYAASSRYLDRGPDSVLVGTADFPTDHALNDVADEAADRPPGHPTDGTVRNSTDGTETGTDATGTRSPDGPA
jgi:NTE family protein